MNSALSIVGFICLCVILFIIVGWLTHGFYFISVIEISFFVLWLAGFFVYLFLNWKQVVIDFKIILVFVSHIEILIPFVVAVFSCVPVMPMRLKKYSLKKIRIFCSFYFACVLTLTICSLKIAVEDGNMQGKVKELYTQDHIIILEQRCKHDKVYTKNYKICEEDFININIGDDFNINDYKSKNFFKPIYYKNQR